jgi:hypothetical protein
VSHPHTVPKGWTRGEPLEITPLERQMWSECSERYETVNKDRWRVGQRLSGLCPVGSIALDDIAFILFDNRAALDAWLKWWKEVPDPGPLIDRAKFLEIFGK